MAGKTRLLEILIALTLLASGTSIYLASSSIALGVTSHVDTRSTFPLTYDPPTIPEPIKADANQLAAALFGDDKQTRTDFAEQLLATYTAARDKDILILFSPGGWGWRHLSDSPYWPGIASGIENNLNASDIETLSLEYRRSNGTLRNHIDELMAMAGLNPRPARILAARVGFLITHQPRLKIILTGESNGTIVCDEVMKILKDNPRVFSIQTGTPFWHSSTPNLRALVINDNGITPDTFSNGDFTTMLQRNIEVWLGITHPAPEQGTVLNWFEAPGHSYTWQNPAVRGQIEDFLNQHFIVR